MMKQKKNNRPCNALALVCLLLLLSGHSMAQQVRFGFKGGVDVATMRT